MTKTKKPTGFSDQQLAQRLTARRNSKAALRARLAGRLITKGLHGRMNMQNRSISATE